MGALAPSAKPAEEPDGLATGGALAWLSGPRCRQPSTHLGHGQWQELFERRRVDHRAHRRARADGKPDRRHETTFQQSRRLQKELLDAERSTVIALRDQGVINDQVLHEIERDLDLEWVRFGRDLEKSVEKDAE